MRKTFSFPTTRFPSFRVSARVCAMDEQAYQVPSKRYAVGLSFSVVTVLANGRLVELDPTVDFVAGTVSVRTRSPPLSNTVLGINERLCRELQVSLLDILLTQVPKPLHKLLGIDH